MTEKQNHAVCLVCPLHPPHFLYGQMLAYQVLRAEVDLCFVFTTAEDRKKFLHLASKGSQPWFRTLVLEDHLSAAEIRAVEAKRLVPVFKKLCALDTLRLDYDWLICIDAETILLRLDRWAEACESLFDSKVWFGGVINTHMTIERRIAAASGTELVPVNDVGRIQSLASQYNWYSWWWDLPAFKSAHLGDFLNWIGWGDKGSVIQRASWFTFEHILYQYFTAVHCGFTLHAVQEVTQSLECSGVADYKLVAETLRAPTWVNCNAYLQDPEYAADLGVMAVYHLDRTGLPSFEPPRSHAGGESGKDQPRPLYDRVAGRVVRTVQRYWR